jgi:hypothetical protein
LRAEPEVMYVYIVTRTQIYLSEQEVEALDRAARQSGLKKSRLIREAIDRAYFGGTDRGVVLQALAQSAGTWKRRGTGARYVERLRRGRLARIHSVENE